jgi:hypothetical protein
VSGVIFAFDSPEFRNRHQGAGPTSDRRKQNSSENTASKKTAYNVPFIGKIGTAAALGDWPVTGRGAWLAHKTRGNVYLRIGKEQTDRKRLVAVFPV